MCSWVHSQPTLRVEMGYPGSSLKNTVGIAGSQGLVPRTSTHTADAGGSFHSGDKGRDMQKCSLQKVEYLLEENATCRC